MRAIAISKRPPTSSSSPSSRLRELEERLRPSKDQVERQSIRSPVDGVVMGLRVAAPGEVLAAGAPIADVVPSNEMLVVEARIRPQDISHVYADAHAKVRLAAFDARTTPMLSGRVTFVSPDRMSDAQTGEAWFAATVEVDAAALRHHPEVQLKAGMPAELFVTTSDRSLLSIPDEPDHRIHQPRACAKPESPNKLGEYFKWLSRAPSLPAS